jgi:short-subunit dehydrogenase
MRDEKLVVLVTGCSSGIGFALAQELYELNLFRVVVTARPSSVHRLTQSFVENENFIIRELDVRSEKSREAIISSIYRKWKSIDVIVNNAGISYRSVMEHMDATSELHQIETNYIGPIDLIRRIIPSMREKGFGRIINVSSVSGFIAMPTMASYTASKHALEGASESLWHELKPFGIRVSLVQPGFVNSESYKKVYLTKTATLSQELEGPYSDYYHHMAPFIEKLMLLSQRSPRDIAKRIIGLILKRNPRLFVPATPDALLFGCLKKIIPRRIFHFLMFWLLPNSKQWATNHQSLSKTRLLTFPPAPASKS